MSDSVNALEPDDSSPSVRRPRAGPLSAGSALELHATNRPHHAQTAVPLSNALCKKNGDTREVSRTREGSSTQSFSEPRCREPPGTNQLNSQVMPRNDRWGRWHVWLALISLGALIPPVLWILVVNPHAQPAGDAFYFQWQAALIANGSGWFISPDLFLFHHQVLQSAQHPPLWVLVLAFSDAIGLKSFLTH